MVSDALLYHNRRSSVSSLVRLRKSIAELASLVVLMFPLGKRRLTSIAFFRGRDREGIESKQVFDGSRPDAAGYRLAVGLSPGDRASLRSPVNREKTVFEERNWNVCLHGCRAAGFSRSCRADQGKRGS